MGFFSDGLLTRATLFRLTLALPTAFQKESVSGEGIPGSSLRLSYNPGQCFGGDPEAELLPPTGDVRFEPGAFAEVLPVVPAVQVSVSELPFRRIACLHVETIEGRISFVVIVLQRVNNVGLIGQRLFEEQRLEEADALGVLESKGRRNH